MDADGATNADGATVGSFPPWATMRAEGTTVVWRGKKKPRTGREKKIDRGEFFPNKQKNKWLILFGKIERVEDLHFSTYDALPCIATPMELMDFPQLRKPTPTADKKLIPTTIFKYYRVD